jgi:hypothetical protein
MAYVCRERPRGAAPRRAWPLVVVAGAGESRSASPVWPLLGGSAVAMVSSCTSWVGVGPRAWVGSIVARSLSIACRVAAMTPDASRSVSLSFWSISAACCLSVCVKFPRFR